MMGNNYNIVKTTPEVWAVIRASHPELVVFGSSSDPDGTAHGGGGTRGRMFTSYGFQGQYAPIIQAETIWDIDPEKPYVRVNEKSNFWLCIGVEE